MEYKIIDAHSKPLLEERVNKHIAEWEPIGGVCCVRKPDSSEFYFYQAMTKRSAESLPST